jgi:hypothetical protein
MSVMIGTVRVENPTATWTQLMNVRHNVLGRKERWNSGAWYEENEEKPRGGGVRPREFTMCLANAIRFVTKASKNMPKELSAVAADSDAEQLVLLAIGQVHGVYAGEIPPYNDNANRRYEDILKVLDHAIEQVAPYARTYAITIAQEVMTPQEKAEVQDAVHKAEDEIWAEYRTRWGVHQDAKGRWRTRKGAFAKSPRRAKSGTPVTTTADVVEQSPAMKEFRGWLDDHQKRGWGTFWDELEACKGDEECEKRLEAALAK